MHLWEVDHQYYCNQANHFAPGDRQPVTSHGNWASFLAEEGDADMDWNLLFRWDWQKPVDEDGDDTDEAEEKLLLFFMNQRKGLYRWVEIAVTHNDEASVIKYLRPRLQHLLRLWEPLQPATAEP